MSKHGLQPRMKLKVLGKINLIMSSVIHLTSWPQGRHRVHDDSLILPILELFGTLSVLLRYRHYLEKVTA